MALLDYDTKMLMQKRGFWYYQRRVPKKYAHINARRFVKKALRTKSVDEAISKRDALIIADNEYWEALSLEALEIGVNLWHSIDIRPLLRALYPLAFNINLRRGLLQKNRQRLYMSVWRY